MWLMDSSRCEGVNVAVHSDASWWQVWPCRWVAGPEHSTSEMIQEDMKILEPRRAQRSRREEYREEKHDGVG